MLSVYELQTYELLKFSLFWQIYELYFKNFYTYKEKPRSTACADHNFFQTPPAKSNRPKAKAPAYRGAKLFNLMIENSAEIITKHFSAIVHIYFRQYRFN